MNLFSLTRKPAIAAAVAVLFGLLLYFYLGRLEQKATLVTGVLDVPILVQDISRGSPITSELIEIVELPVEQVPVGWIDGTSVLGMEAAIDLPAGTMLTVETVVRTQHVETPTHERSSLARGSQAFTVHVPEDEALQLSPGSIVGLIALFPAGRESSEQSVVLADNVTVLDVATDAVDPDETGSHTYGYQAQRMARLTLAVDGPMAQRLALADEFGKIRVIQGRAPLTKSKDEGDGPGPNSLTLGDIIEPRESMNAAGRGGESGDESRRTLTVIKGTKFYRVPVP